MSQVTLDQEQDQRQDVPERNLPEESQLQKWWNAISERLGFTEEEKNKEELAIQATPDGDAGAVGGNNEKIEAKLAANDELLFWTAEHQAALEEQLRLLEIEEAQEQGTGQAEEAEGDQEEQDQSLTARFAQIAEKNVELEKEEEDNKEKDEPEVLANEKQSQIVGFDEAGQPIVLDAETKIVAETNDEGDREVTAHTQVRAYVGDQSLGQTNVKTDLGLEAGDTVEVSFGDGSKHNATFTGKFAEGVGADGAAVQKPIVEFPGSAEFAIDAKDITANVTKDIKNDMDAHHKTDESEDEKEQQGSGMKA